MKYMVQPSPLLSSSPFGRSFSPPVIRHRSSVVSLSSQEEGVCLRVLICILIFSAIVALMRKLTKNVVLISPELGTTFFSCKQRSLPPKLGLLRYNPQQDLGFLDSLKFNGKKSRHQRIYGVPSPNICRAQSLVVKCCNNPQNVDLPRYYSKKEKKPFPVPIVELRRAARERMKSRKGQPKRSAPPPKNGLLVQRMIPLAYATLNARTTLINTLKKLLKVVPVQACKYCNEIHVGPVGHPFRSCQGQNSSIRKGKHEWVDAVVDDILVQIEAYHLYDRLGKRIPHEERFSVPRIPALVELCIQAGVDLPEFPTKRRRKPIIRISKSEFIDADESELPDPISQDPKPMLLTEIPDWEIVPPSNAEQTVLLAEETLQAWEKMRGGANRLMKMYPVRVCGYCPEIHVGPTGHKAQNCGAYKHQQRNGQHGWQSAVLNDLIPARYVWHVPNLEEPLLQKELRNFYGQAPAVVEICVQGGAAVPEQYKPTMRLDVGIPSSVREAEMVV
ncbi:APO domain-containing protein [Cynara cardunculus var. scolymus]|uniref:APO domain-containing protein n=1 Tax=Cynara cardunculus var. scolymus TaxID=59895 RepID=A0A103YD75_CYNCS|nr:APO domain-containing protein [Cynara cardunculus var. scolymus]